MALLFVAESAGDWGSWFPAFAPNHPSDEDLSLGTPEKPREDGAREFCGPREKCFQIRIAIVKTQASFRMRACETLGHLQSARLQNAWHVEVP